MSRIFNRQKEEHMGHGEEATWSCSWGTNSLTWLYVDRVQGVGRGGHTRKEIKHGKGMLESEPFGLKEIKSFLQEVTFRLQYEYLLCYFITLFLN